MELKTHRLLLAFTLLAGLLIVPAFPGSPAGVAQAAGTPDVSLDKTMPAEQLYGVPIPVSLRLTNPGGPDGFNVMFTDVLPDGVDFVSGTPAPSTIATQSDGTTLLVWSNVADMLTGAAVNLDYVIDVDQAVFASGDVVTNSAQAFVNSDPRVLPKIDPSPTNLSGDALAASYSGNDSASASTLLIPFELTKEGGTAEDELLRGVHDQQTVYTLTVDNNAVNATTGFTLVDYLPASLEFLGCAPIIDSSSVVVSPAVISEEYPGSGIIPSGAATTNPCAVPSSVTTVDVDPDGAGPMPSGVYTRVEWNSTSLAAAIGSADLAASGSFSIDYITAIPLQQNTFPGPTPATANLDNNTGAYTTETAGETSLSNYAEASGTYFTDGSPTIDSDIDMAVIEDLSIHKTVDMAEFTQDSVPIFTLLIESSEYALSTGPITVTDTIPSALDFVSASPPPEPGFVDNGDGTLTYTWILPAFTAPNSSATITLNTDVRDDFRGTTTPVSSSDSYANTTTLAADVTVITDNTGTTEVLPLIDESSAAQSASGPDILKEVSEPQASLTCGDGAGITFNPSTAGNYRPGDRVCYRLTVNFPSQLDTITPIIDDYLPDGFAVEGWAIGANNNIDLTGATVPEAPFDDDVPRMRWNLSNVDRGGNKFEVVIQTIISDPSANDPGDITDNLMKFRYSNAVGGVFQKRDGALAVLSEAILDLAKGVIEVNSAPVAGAPADGITVQEGDTVTYQLAVSNSGNEPATNVSVRDVLPVGVVCGNVVAASITNGGVCVTPVAPLTDYIQWDTDDGIAVAAAGFINLTYDVVMPTGISAGATLTNSAGVRQYSGDTNTGTPFVYVPGNNIDTTLTPTNTDPADDTSNVITALPTITKTRTTSVNEAGNAANNQATIGETVSYTIDTTLAGGVSFYNAVIDDNIDTEKDLVESSVVVTRDGVAVPIGPAPTGFQVDTTGNGIEVTFPTPYVIPNGAGQAFEITFDVIITDVASNTRTTGSGNRVDFDYENAAGTGRNVNDSVGLQIVEPNITIAKSNNDADGVVTAGQTVTYTLAVENDNTVPNVNVASNRVSTAHDTVVVDTVPPELIVQTATISNGGIYVAGVPATNPGTITWNIATIAPGTSAALTYDVATANPLVASNALKNTAVATTTSMPGVVAGERTSTSPNGDANGDGYTDDADSTVTVPVLTLTKTAAPATATVGEPVTFSVNVTIPGGITAYDVTVIDDMPAGVTFESLTSVTCAQGGGACSPDLATTDALVVPAGPTYASGDDIAFFFDDLTTAATADRVVTVTYVGFVSNAAAANNGSTLTNGATVNWNGSDTITTPPTAVPAPTTFDETSPVGSDSVGTVEPSLAIDKDVTGQVADSDTRRAKPGDVLAYTVTVTNTGTAPAYDVRVTDVPTDATWVFADTTATAGTTNTDSTPAGGLEWTIDGPIPALGTATITYTLTVPVGYNASNEVAAGPEQSNTADIPSYFAVPETTRTLNPGRTYREYTVVTADIVTIELDLASIGDDVWFDVNNDGVQQGTEPVLANVGVTVTYLGLDGALGGGDDEVFSTATGADGKYVVNNLPGGNYLVDVDESDPDFITGLVATFDLDDGTAATDGVSAATLGEDENKRDVDFGYTGTGSIAQSVWFDQDKDGVVDANEAGIENATVTVTWAGPDGDLSTLADNVVYVTTTDENGEYLVENLPPGGYSVVVSSLPSGYDNVSEPGAENDSANTLTLGTGEANVGQNFGYAGVGTVGNFIWLDRSNDGLQDAGEPGLGGVMVQLTSFGPDGASGGDDDSVYSTTTDANGAYLFSNLPPGKFEVEVIGALPANVVNTFDPDVAGPGNSSSSVTLTLAVPSDLDQDFGYYGASTLGNRVWLDVNGNGVADDGSEPGINNVQVTATYFGPDGVLGGVDDEVFVATTSGNGDYLFENVPDGSYQVAVTGGIAPGLTQTFDSSGAQTDGISNTTLATEDLLQDFSYTGAGSIGDTVWFDSDKDGVLDAGETGLEGVTVTLTWFGLDGVSGGGDDIVLTTTTSATGTYSFPNLPDGEFVVAVNTATLPTGMTATFDSDGGIATPNSSTPATLTGGTSIDTVDFGYSGAGSIGDTIWFDRDGDGVFDADEYPLANVTVQLVWASPTGPRTYTATTDAAGMYLFPNLPPGDYDVNVVTSSLPVGLTATFDGDQVANGLGNTSALTLADGENNAAQDFGYNGSASIGNTIYLDLNGDGVQGPGEAGIEGQTVVLTWQGPSGPVTFTTLTDTNGNYLFDNLPDGNFTVTVTGGIVDLATNTGFPVGGGSSTNNVTIAGGVPNSDQDFGYQGINSIGDTVFWDQGNNGAEDATDPGLANVVVTLTWFGLDGIAGNSDDVTLPVDTTDTTGDYGFTGLPDGSYSVAVTGGLPAGLDANTFDGDDLAVNPNGISIVTGLGVGNSNAVNNVGQDFGYTGTGSIGDDVWFDVNKDGFQQTTEPVLANVTVTVRYLGLDDTPNTADDVVFPAVTGVDGKYVVNNLPAGLYIVDVDESDPDFITGLVATFDLDGGTATPDGVSAATLAANEDKRDVDFGYTGTGSVAQTVWFDQDKDGVVDANEAGIEGATVTVTWAGPDGDPATTGDNVVYTTTTDKNGEYLVENLPPGDHSVVVTGVPVGYDNVSEPGAENDSANTLTLAVGEVNTDQNFGYAGVGSIGNFIWLDQNSDGVQDAGEPGLGGVMAQLTSFGPDGVRGGDDDSVFMTTTLADGSYLFSNLPPGLFEVEVTGALPANATNTFNPEDNGPGDSTSNVELTLAVPNDLDQDFGYNTPSALGDRVWLDVNGDGLADDGTEPGINNVQVTATYFGPDGVLGGVDDEVFVTTTSGNGDYLFENVPDGNYQVAVTGGIAPGLTQTFDSSGAQTDGISNTTLATEDLLQDFSYTGAGSIGDTVWFDSNKDGVLDTGETGLAGVTVNLTWFGLDGVSGGGDDIVLTATTSATGTYGFPNLPDGEFVVAVNTSTLPTGMTATFDSDGGIATPNSSTSVTLAGGVAIDTVDFGYSGSGSIGDTIWFDRDGDGVFDADEYPLENVTVALVWASPTGPQTYTATTNAMGMYLFPNLPPAGYTVTVQAATLPVGLTATFDGDQVANGLGDTSALTLADGEGNAAQDFGYNGSASIGAAIFLDLDGDGLQGPGEAGIEGQTVVLTWQGPSGPVTFTTATDVNGNYAFDNLPDGDYTVTVTGGIVDLATNTGFPVGGGSSTNDVTIAGGVANSDQAFGYQGINSIGDTVFWDQGNNGVDDATDPGLANVALTLTWFGLDGIAGNSDDVSLPVDTTDAAGNYGFIGLPDGSYSVEVTGGLPAGLDTNTFDGDDLTVSPNGISIVTDLGVGDASPVNNLDQDFGYTGTGSIGDTIYFDTNGNGAQNSGEPGIPNATVTLTWGGPDGNLATLGDNVTYPSMNTGADGGYLYENLPAGPFQVDVVNPLVGTIPTQDPNGGADSAAILTLATGENNLVQDFGYTGTGSIGDTVWFDQNLDGVKNPGEDGIVAVDVTVTWAGPDGDILTTGDNIVYRATTDIDGLYVVQKLPAGPYTVVVDTDDLPADYINVSEPGPEGDSMTTLTLGDAENNRVQDFGYAGSGQIGNTIYLDQNGDGDQDAGEPGLVGVTLKLVAFGPDGVLGGGDDSFFETVTGPNGQYLFENLPFENYQVTVTGGITTVGNTDDPDLPGAPDAGDSVSTTTLTAGSPSDLDQDFGYFADSVLGDRIWWDRNADGVQAADEPGFGGVVVQITSPSLAIPLTTTTDAAGNYLFVNIPNSVGAEEYTVTILSGVPDGFSQTFDADGVGQTDETSMVALTDADLAQDFGYNGTGSIGDTIWFDTDASGGGGPDGAEFGLQGVTVTLTWVNPDGDPLTNDDIVLTTVTDANGNYSFANLPNGDFIVDVDESTLPAGLSETFDLNGELDGQGTTAVTLTDASNTVTDVDFGYNGAGSIGDTIWFDRNGDGVYDPATEYPLSGIGVTLTWNSSQGVETFNTTTGPDGTYLFDNVAPGDYTVAVTVADLPAGMLPTFDADQVVNGLNSASALTLADGENNADQDFGYNGQGQIGDTIYLDLDGDGTQGPGEPGVANQTVLLGWTGPDGRVTFTVTTDGNGAYIFDGLPAGAYDVTVVNGVVNDAVNTGDPTTPGIGDSTNTLTLTTGGVNLSQDFGYQGANTIGDRIWFDTDGDGVDDAGEPGLAGVEVTVVWFGPDNLPGTDDDVTLPTQITAADGSYSLTGVPDGNFSVTVTDGLPAGLNANTYDGDGMANGTSVVTGLGVGVAGPAQNLDQDFGYTGTGRIGDKIWLDLDGDGVLDPGEPGIPGVEVTLTGAGPDGVLGTADDVVYPTQTTGPAGTFLFDNLPAGDFQVVVVNPVSGLTLSTDPDGTVDGTTIVNLDPAEVDLDQDFAYIGDASIGDTIFLDVDGDGVQDANEPGLAGITVTVTAGGVDGILGTPDDIIVMVDTDANGVYIVEKLPAGPVSVTYDVADLGAGLAPGSDLDSGDAKVAAVVLGAGANRRDVDFAIVGDATISGVVYQDTNGNGIQDAGEPGIGGVTIDVTFNGPDGPVVLRTTTDANGNWSLTSVPPGDYVTTVVESSVPNGLVPSTPINVSTVLPAGGQGTTNYGFVPTGSIGDTVYTDTNGNGAQDPGEPGVSGVTITVTAPNGDVRTVVTGTNGVYVVDDLPPGNYVVRLDPATLPPGVVVTGDPDGTPDGTTSVTVGPGQDVTTIDFGFRTPPVNPTGLPATGATIALTLLLGALLLAAGWFLLGTTRRRRRHS